MKEGRRGIHANNMLWGAFLILAAVFLIVSKLGNFEGVGLFSILFTVFWVSILVEGVMRRSFGRILFALAFLCIIYDKQLGIEAITPWTVLIAAWLGTMGLNMMFRKRKHHCEINWKKKDDTIIDVEVNGDFQEEGYYQKRSQVDSLNGNKVFFSTSFGSAVKYVDSNNFEYASLECSFASMKVYFDKVMIQNGSATVELDVSFGSVELYFPKEWSVVNHMDTAFGGIDEKNQNASTGSPVIMLTGDVSFGNVTIIYV